EKAHRAAHHAEDKNSEELKEDMEFGEIDEDIETNEGRELLVEDDEISPEEAGFVEGASNEGQLAKDALTGEPLMGIDDVVELEIDGKLYRFVNEENAQKFRDKKNSP
ncbi:MAG: hypothetical protein ABIH82_05605, partial [Candidatus Woesearchaeota archaeon]